MLKSSQGIREKSIKTKPDEKLSSRRLSREISLTNPSLEVYYGRSPVSISFGWESQSGTPRVKYRENPLPPLTPPPSFHSNAEKKPVNKHSKSSLLLTVLPKLNLRKTQVPPSPALSSSSSSTSSSSPWSSSHSVPSSPCIPTDLRGHSRDSSLRSLFDSKVHEEDDDYDSPVSTLCFGSGRGANARSHGCCSLSIMKVLLKDFS